MKVLRWSPMRANDLASAIIPAYTICQLTGLVPLKNDRSVSWTLLGLTLGLTFCLTAGFLHNRAGEPCLEATCTRNLVMAVVCTANPPILFLAVAANSPNGKEYRAVVHRSVALLTKLRRTGLDVSHDRTYLFKVAFITSIWLAHLSYLLFLNTSRKDLPFLNLLIYRTSELFPVLMYYYIIEPTLVVITIFTKYFHLLCKNVNIIENYGSIPMKLHKIEEMLHLYNELCEMCDILEECVGVVLFLLVLGVFLNLTSSLFLITGHVMNMTIYELDMSNGATVSLIVWTSYWIFLLLDIIRTCEKCKKQAKEFSSALYNMVIEDKTKELVNNDKLQLHLLMKREVRFTACGFFPLDNTLIHSMIAAATTYLVILIQFGPYEKKESKPQ